MPKSLWIYPKFQKCQIKNPPNINKIVHKSYIVDFKFLKKLKTNALVIVEQTLYPTHSTNFLSFLHFLEFSFFSLHKICPWENFLAKSKTLHSPSVLAPWCNINFWLFIKMKHYTLVQFVEIWRSVRVGSRPTVRQWKAKMVGSGSFGNAKGRSITNNESVGSGII